MKNRRNGELEKNVSSNTCCIFLLFLYREWIFFSLLIRQPCLYPLIQFDICYMISDVCNFLAFLFETGFSMHLPLSDDVLRTGWSRSLNRYIKWKFVYYDAVYAKWQKSHDCLNFWTWLEHQIMTNLTPSIQSPFATYTSIRPSMRISHGLFSCRHLISKINCIAVATRLRQILRNDLRRVDE